MNSDFKKQEKRINSVFLKKTDDNSRRFETLEIYKQFLEENIDFPVKLTGIEDFNWEEFYIFGPGNKKEYEELKKTRPSYTDTYNLIQIEDYIEEEYGLLAKVTRISDRKKFQIPLVDLEAVDKKSTNFQLLDDYSVWFCNY